VIRLDPKFAPAFYNRAITYESNKDYDRAIADYTEAIHLTPDNPSYWNNLCWSRAVAGQFEQAVKDCNESLILRPNESDTFDSRGFAYLKSGDFDRAIADYDAALRLDPKKAGSLYGRGFAKRKKGDMTGNADIAAAKAIRANIVEEYAAYGSK
jgi:tetratricopeptide (TPR) repeat protein